MVFITNIGNLAQISQKMLELGIINQMHYLEQETNGDEEQKHIEDSQKAISSYILYIYIYIYGSLLRNRIR